MLYRLIYASTAQDSVDSNEFRKILDTAQKKNAARDLTGYLVFNSKVFLQGLEGSREAINDLYAKLMRDPRHFNLMVLKYNTIEVRQWAEWSMGFAAANTNNRKLFLKYGLQSTFNPYGMTPDNSERILFDLAEQSHATQAGLNNINGTEAAANESTERKGILARFIR
jgi:hypothetical protein